MTDPLDKIFTTESEINPKILAEILGLFVRINSEDQSIFFTSEGTSLPTRNKLLLFLIAKKALKYREKIKVEEISPNEIINEIGIKAGTVHPALKSLRDEGLVLSKGGKYFVPNYLLDKVKKKLVKEG